MAKKQKVIKQGQEHQKFTSSSFCLPAATFWAAFWPAACAACGTGTPCAAGRTWAACATCTACGTWAACGTCAACGTWAACATCGTCGPRAGGFTSGWGNCTPGAGASAIILENSRRSKTEEMSFTAPLAETKHERSVILLRLNIYTLRTPLCTCLRALNRKGCVNLMYFSLAYH